MCAEVIVSSCILHSVITVNHNLTLFVYSRKFITPFYVDLPSKISALAMGKKLFCLSQRGGSLSLT